MKTIVIIQARMGSTRLPGKILKDLIGEPLLAHVVQRCRRATLVDEVALAIPESPENQAIAELCAARGWPCVAGSENDVLDRYHSAALVRKADIVVRVTSDCPLIDPEVMDLVIRRFHEACADYASNCMEPRTYPRGLDVEVLGFPVLERIWREDRNPAWREHVTPYLYRNPDLFHLLPVSHDRDYSFHRWTVDTPEDFDLIERIYRHFGHDKFTWREVLLLFERFPEWLAINQQVRQKEVP